MKITNRLLALTVLTAVATMTAAAATLQTGAPAPAFQLNSNAGKPLALADFRGQIVLLNFWASWCGPCRQEMPILEQLNRQYHGKGVTLLGVNVEPDSAAAVAWLKATPVTFPILFDTDSKVSSLYEVAGMPNTVIIDRKGLVRYIHRGYAAGAENDYLNQIRALIRE
jgi:peroxiredoxin